MSETYVIIVKENSVSFGKKENAKSKS